MTTGDESHLVRHTNEVDGMVLQVKKFGIPHDMVKLLEGGGEPLPNDLKKAVESSEADNDV